MAVTSVPGIIDIRLSAALPRTPTPMQATRTFFIGLSANPCIGAPVVPKSFSGLFAQPAAIATAPIHAADVKNSLLVFMVVLSFIDFGFIDCAAIT